MEGKDLYSPVQSNESQGSKTNNINIKCNSIFLSVMPFSKMNFWFLSSQLTVMLHRTSFCVFEVTKIICLGIEIHSIN